MDIRITIGFTVTLQDNFSMWHPVVLPKLNKCYFFLSVNTTLLVNKHSSLQC